MQLPILSLITVLLSLLTTGWLKQNLLDIPNDRSSHSQPTPRGGGLGFIIAFASTTMLTPILSSYFPKIFPTNLLQIISPQSVLSLLLPTWAILTPLAIIGILDDRHNILASIRYLVQLTAAGIALLCFGPFPQPWLTSFGLPGQIIAYSLTLIAITALINFYNFMDGLDGLVAGVTIVQLGFLALYLNQPLWWLLVAALEQWPYPSSTPTTPSPPGQPSPSPYPSPLTPFMLGIALSWMRFYAIIIANQPDSIGV